MDREFTDLVDAHLCADVLDEKPKEREAGRYWPSAASAVLNFHGRPLVVGACLRQQYYYVTGEEPTNPVNARGERIFAIGRMIEAQEIQWYKEVGVWLADHVKFQHEIGELTISGETDALVKNTEGKPVGIELKTGYGYYFEKEVIGSNKKEGAPKVENVMQVMLYLDHFQNELKKVEYFKLIYIDRGNMGRVEYRVELDNGRVLVNGVPGQLTMDDIYKRYRELDGYIRMKTLPERDYTRSYSEDTIEHLYKHGKLSKKKYGDFHRGYIIGDWCCSDYCRFFDKCYGGK